MSDNATVQSNFEFLKEYDGIFFELASGAERVFSSDPNMTVIKLRQFGEALAQHIATVIDITFDSDTKQDSLIRLINYKLQLEPAINSLFHILRKEGNTAVHQFETRHKEALEDLRVARSLAIWFHTAFGSGNKRFKAEPFIKPVDPSDKLNGLKDEIAALKSELTEANGELESSQRLSDLLAQEKAEYEALALTMDEESRQLAEQAKAHEALLEALTEEHEKALKIAHDKIQALTESERANNQRKITTRTQRAGLAIELSEEQTRIAIDLQLLETGWDADSQDITYKKGARPEKGKCKAIAEWPTEVSGEKGRADYVLFDGLTPVGVVEAKKANANVSGKIGQAERYSRGFKVVSPMTGAWCLEGQTVAWPDDQDGHYLLPFVFSCNGRGYVPQLAEQSGVWFRDVRQSSNIKRALRGFYTPQGLRDLLERSKAEAEQKLSSEPYGYLKLRDYQQKAIEATETKIAQDVRSVLLAMATGTGKTRTIIGLMYRFLKAERFKRILFLVDRTTLGDQALDAFKEAPLEQNQTLSKIYNIAELGDMQAEAETRVQVATVQAMVQRVFASRQPPAVDEFDCIIVDEAHRGYTLDQEMTEGEIETRDSSQYLSSYRRVLDYFDAVKIGLTATPAKHTSDIFGHPAYTYSYREAVADDWLIDHEPPIRYATKLSENGIQFGKGEHVEAINTQTGEIETAELEDDLDFDVGAFNKRVINKSFNKVICDELVKELDPFGDEKTMIFCATDLHADTVKSLLDEAFKDLYDDEYNQAAVEKITGKSDKVSQLIKRYKNERYPNIAITVDLLTTGIDVPKICNLVFMRRVRSRILFEQMIGRATRRCDEIGKTVFRIYDPVDIYASLDKVNTMKPLVKDPNVTLEQLVEELSDDDKREKALSIAGEQPQTSHADDLLSQLSQKVMRVMRKAEKRAETKPELKQKLGELETTWGVEPKELHSHLHKIGPVEAAKFLQQHRGLINQIERVKTLVGSDHAPIISDHKDEIREPTQTYGTHQKPEDYLESFNDFIKNQMNQSAALSVVVNKPRDMTREQLKEVRLLLDEQGFTEASLQSAVRQQTNQDIAASIVGHIRRAALGEALIPFEQRIAKAMEAIYAAHSWKPPQRKWLERLAKQLTHEVVIDREFVNNRFADDGGFKKLDKVLGDQLDEILVELSDAVWLKQV